MSEKGAPVSDRAVRGILAASAVLLATACRPDGRPGVPPPPPPPFTSIDSVAHQDFLKYAASLEYDVNTGYGDRQALAVAKVPGGKCPEECEYGPVARIEPQVGAIALTPEDLKVGRILGRVINESDAPYEKLNLGSRDTLYAWVEQVNGEIRGRLISSDAGRFERSLRPRPVEKPDGPHQPRYVRSTARWIWTVDDETMWLTCPVLGCCQYKETP